MTNHQSRNYLGWAALLGVAALGCDFSVTNPGPVEDRFLDELTARRAIVTGAQRALANSIQANQGDILYYVAAITFELNPAGSTGSFGISTQVQDGRLLEDIQSYTWNDASEARWVAEDAVRRLTKIASPEDSLLAVANLWAGYANRLMGENFCNAVIDGGPEEARTVYFTRAEGYFTEANRVAGLAGKANVASAALAGRASARAYLATYNSNNTATWASAAADAAAVTSNTFRWVLPFSDQAQDQYNGLFHAQAGQPYKAHTQWATYYDLYNRTTAADTRITWLMRLQSASTTVATAAAPGATSITVADAGALGTGARAEAWLVVDATGTKEVHQIASVSGNTFTLRTPMSSVHAAGQTVRLAELGDAAVGKFGGNVPHFPQQKYASRTAPVAFSSGWEMRLLQAEEALVRGQGAEAVGYMNQRRANLSLSNIPVGTPDEAWTALKAERALELWLEARRLGDLSRWDAAPSPGTTFDGVWRDTDGDGTWEQLESMTTPNQRSLCFPVGRGEKQTNCHYLGTCS